MAFDTIVSLVGENPLPIYLGIKQFANAQSCRIVLVCSDKTLGFALNIQQVFERQYQSCGDLFVFEQPAVLEDPFDPVSVETTLSNIFARHPGAALNYTGGTKVMSSCGHFLWRTNDQPAFYLDEGAGVFRFANGAGERLLDGAQVTLPDIYWLHGLAPSSADDPKLNIEDIRNLWEFARHKRRYQIFPDNQKNPEGLYNHWDEWQKFLNLLTDESRRELEKNSPTLVNARDHHTFNSCGYEAKLDLASTGWLEHLAAACVKEAGVTEDVIVSKYFEIQAHGRSLKEQGRYKDFELDTLWIRNNRLFVCSATTATGPKMAKHKMYEVMFKAQKLGGGLARCFVLSPADQRTVDGCNFLFSNERVIFFGEADVDEWVNGNLHSLVSFIDR